MRSISHDGKVWASTLSIASSMKALAFQNGTTTETSGLPAAPDAPTISA